MENDDRVERAVFTGLAISMLVLGALAGIMCALVIIGMIGKLLA